METLVRLQVETSAQGSSDTVEPVIIEGVLRADSRGKVADLLRLLGGIAPGDEDATGAGEERTVLGVYPPAEYGGKPYGLEPWRALSAAPIPAGSTLFVAQAGTLLLAPRDQAGFTVLNPHEERDTSVAAVRLRLPSSPRLWVANLATLAVPTIPVLVFGAAALLAPGLVTVGLLLAALGAAGAEFAYARRDNQREWRRFLAELEAKPAEVASLNQRRDQSVRDSIPAFETLVGVKQSTGSDRTRSVAGTRGQRVRDRVKNPRIWGYDLENPGVPVGFTRQNQKLAWDYQMPQNPYKGPGSMGQERHDSGGESQLLSKVTDAAVPVLSTPVEALSPVYAHAGGGSLAVVGGAKWRRLALNHLVGRLAVRYRPDRLGMVVLADAARKRDWGWAGYLPHVATARCWLKGEPATIPGVLNDTGTVARLAAALREVMHKHPKRRLVLVVDGIVPAGSPLETLRDVPGMWMVNAVEERGQAIGECRQVLDLRTGSFLGGVNASDWEIYWTGGALAPGSESIAQATQDTTRHDSRQSLSASRYAIEPLLAAAASVRSLAVWLAGYRTSAKRGEELPLAAQLTDAWPITSDVLAGAVDEAGNSAWQPRGSLRAPLGYGAGGVVELDLSSGRNALFSGENTAARGNAMAAYLAGLCVRNAPEDLNFLLFDSRGVSWSEIATSPHCLGLETARGQQVYERLMRYLEAESKRRAEWLETQNVRDLDTARARGMSAPAELLVVLASAETFTGQQLVDLVGRVHLYRGLGIHTLLGVGDPTRVPGEILGYLPTRVVLQLDGDKLSLACGSVEVRGERVYTVPGRAVLISSGVATPLQVLNALAVPETRDLATLPISFQALPGQEETVSAKLADSSSLGQLPTGKPAAGAAERILPLTQVSRLFQAGTASGVPWIGQLGTRYNLAKLGQGSDGLLVLGVQDDPAQQRIQRFGFTLSQQGSLLVAGGAGSGRSTALRVLAADCLNTGGTGVGLYILAGQDGWAAVTDWSNVGVVATVFEPEVMSDTLEYLSGLVAQRQTETWVESPENPRLVLIIDGLEAVLEVLPGVVSGQLLQIVTGGRAVGVHLAVSATSLDNLPVAWRSAFGQRLYLDKHGSGLLEGDARPVQVAILGNDPDWPAQTRVLERLGELTRQMAGDGAGGGNGVFVQKIRRQPVPLYASSLVPASSGKLALGLEVTTGAQMEVSARGTYLVTGTDALDRGRSLRYLAGAMRRSYDDTGLVFLSLTDSAVARELAAWKDWDAVALGAAELDQYRHQLLAVAERAAPDNYPGLAVFVTDFPALAGNQDLSELAVELVQAARERGHLLVADGDLADWEGESAPVAAAKAAATGLALGADSADIRAVFGVSVPQDGRIFPAGRGYWIAGGRAVKIQVPEEK